MLSLIEALDEALQEWLDRQRQQTNGGKDFPPVGLFR
jgi:hypothetical protein